MNAEAQNPVRVAMYEIVVMIYSIPETALLCFVFCVYLKIIIRYM